ncbi:hypothetical protein HMPREF1986_02474 [Oribacterium sp. oral taxon 078 str. F0263]|nr:hypothetical protein HMPREF1986_02474 [Oribacterium sp. oral taxon 078 str. F0263]
MKTPGDCKQKILKKNLLVLHHLFSLYSFCTVFSMRRDFCAITSEILRQ